MVYGLGFRIFRVYSLRFRIFCDLGFRVYGFLLRVLGFRV